VAAQVLSVAAAAAVCVLSPLEHGRNVAPSALLTGYLALALLSDAVRAGLLLVAWNLCWPGSRWSSWAVVAAPAARLGLYLLEARTKRSILREPWARTLPPEDTAGYFGVAFFWWVNTVLRKGYATVFSLADMPPLGPSMDVVLVREAMLKEWDRRGNLPFFFFSPLILRILGRVRLDLANIRNLMRQKDQRAGMLC